MRRSANKCGLGAIRWQHKLQNVNFKPWEQVQNELLAHPDFANKYSPLPLSSADSGVRWSGDNDWEDFLTDDKITELDLNAIKYIENNLQFISD